MTTNNTNQFPTPQEKIDGAILQASAKAVQKAMDTGTPLIIEVDGEIVEVPPSEYEYLIVAAKKEKAERLAKQNHNADQ